MQIQKRKNQEFFSLIHLNKTPHKKWPVGAKALIGCHARNDIRLLHGVSEFHVQIEAQKGEYTLTDLTESGRVLINQRPVHRAALINKDLIQIGSHLFQFVRSDDKLIVDEIESHNPHWQQCVRQLPRLAQAPYPALLIGPTGSGKEVIANALHQLSPRSDHPFVTVNCATFTENFIESELFGHLKGSFTGATESRQGAFETARNGTLFLDEIGDLPFSLQPKLLRALENQEVRPIGSDKVIKTNVRVIGATHKNLNRLVQEKRFRQDLLYRLNILPIHLPALKDRMEDFEKLTFTFAREFRVRFSFEALQVMKTYSWPGNIRELRNFVIRCSFYSSNSKIELDDVRAILQAHFAESPHLGKTSALSNNIKLGSLKKMEKEIIVQALIRNGGNQRKTAFELGMAKSTLHDRIKNYEIDVRSLIIFN